MPGIFYARMHPQAAAEKKLMQNECRPLQMRSKERILRRRTLTVQPLRFPHAILHASALQMALPGIENILD